MIQIKITCAIILANILTGTASVCTRYLVAYLEPAEIVFLRYLFGGAFILSLFILSTVKKPTTRVIVISILLGILFFALFPFLFSLSFSYTTAARGALVIATMPIWSMLLAHLFKHEQLSGKLLSSVILTFTGLTIALFDKLSTSTSSLGGLTGELIMLAAAVVGAIYTTLVKQTLKDEEPLSYTPVMMFAGCLFMSIWAIDNDFINHVSDLTISQMVIMVYLGIMAGGLAFFLFNWVLQHSTATYATMFVPLNPLTAILLGWLLLGEALTTNFMIGTAIVLTGLTVGQLSLKKIKAG